MAISLPARANIAKNNARNKARDPIQNEKTHISMLVAVDPSPINETGETRKPTSNPTSVTDIIRRIRKEWNLLFGNRGE